MKRLEFLNECFLLLGRLPVTDVIVHFSNDETNVSVSAKLDSDLFGEHFRVLSKTCLKITLNVIDSSLVFHHPNYIPF